jgi:hypothetical protein
MDDPLACWFFPAGYAATSAQWCSSYGTIPAYQILTRIGGLVLSHRNNSAKPWKSKPWLKTLKKNSWK